jgi:hypothetical protein
MGIACSIYGEERNVCRILVGKPEGKRPLGRRTRRWCIILRLILEGSNGIVWTGSIRLRIGASGGFL